MLQTSPRQFLPKRRKSQGSVAALAAMGKKPKSGCGEPSSYTRRSSVVTRPAHGGCQVLRRYTPCHWRPPGPPSLHALHESATTPGCCGVHSTVGSTVEKQSVCVCVFVRQCVTVCVSEREACVGVTQEWEAVVDCMLHCILERVRTESVPECKASKGRGRGRGQRRRRRRRRRRRLRLRLRLRLRWYMSLTGVWPHPCQH